MAQRRLPLQRYLFVVGHPHNVARSVPQIGHSTSVPPQDDIEHDGSQEPELAKLPLRPTLYT